MEIFGYLASILIGISLGLIGSGGKHFNRSYVGLSVYDGTRRCHYPLSFNCRFNHTAGSIAYYRKGLVNLKTAIIFGIPSIISVFITRAYIVPAIPNHVFNVGDYFVNKAFLMMLLFAILMILASYSMIKNENYSLEKAIATVKLYLKLL